MRDTVAVLYLMVGMSCMILSIGSVVFLVSLSIEWKEVNKSAKGQD